MSKRWIGCDIEAEYFGEDRKEGKMARKRAQAKDRSKYKKTDQQKLQKAQGVSQAKQTKEIVEKGRALSVTSSGVKVEGEDKNIYMCTLRGVLKKEKTTDKNLVTVGDLVFFKKISPSEGVIVQIEPRHSILARADNLSRRKSQLIAANIDQVLITVSVCIPPLKSAIVDRYIIAAMKGNMTPVIVVNKIDLLENDLALDIQAEKQLYEQFVKTYLATGIDVISVSVLKNMGMDRLKEVMKDKASVFSGPSGVGKSSLINAVTHLNLKVGMPVQKTGKGAHTTSTAELIPLEFGGFCIDTPGIKSFGIWDLKKEEVESYFSEIYATGKSCRYLNCSHTQEQDCAVKQAVLDGTISPLRYESCVSLMQTIEQEHLRR